MKMKLPATLLASLALVSVLSLTGCATPAKPEAMTSVPLTVGAVNARLKGLVTLRDVSGGEPTNPLWTSQVDNESFRKALQDSLAAYGYLAADPAAARYGVSAKLFRLDQPLFGLTLDVKSNVLYELTGADTAKSYSINATGSANFSDAAIAIQRLRISNERSILENIREFLSQLGRFGE